MIQVVETIADCEQTTESFGDELSKPSAWEGGWPQTLEEFSALVDAFQHRLVRHSYRILGNIADAEDVAQEVFVQAYAEREERRTVANVSAYLYRMTGNRCIDMLRRRGRAPESLDVMSEVLQIPARHPDACTIAAAAEQMLCVEGLLGKVSPEQAQAIRLRVMDELPPREIAVVLGCSVATVKSRLRYGMEKLREIVVRDMEVKR